MAEREAAALCGTYRRVPVTLVRGDGCFVETADGRRLLDLVGGIAVNLLGHCQAEVVAAATAQMGRLMHTSNLYYTEPQVELAERLAASAFPSRAFLCNSGAEANEAAIKVARKWGQLHRQGAYTILTLEGAFHGRTLATLAATGNAHYSDPFRPLPNGFRQVPRDDLGAVELALADPGRPAVAVMAEPIQGESGVHLLEDSYLRGLRELCDQHQALLILDEVQTGMGRTGRMWAYQHSGAVPDVMTVAKGVGGGLPLGAALVGKRADVFEAGDHGSTFGGNPVAAAAGLAVLRVVERDHLWQRAAVAGDQFKEAILSLRQEGHPVVETRGRGLLLGVGLASPIAAELGRLALDEGILVNPIGDSTIRLAPPLTISDGEIEMAVAAIGRALGRASGASRP
ncbi:MAG: acetylornithine/succinylornithine family transaminase [Candidatus Dormibacteraeota bacterium]|nr:acetylornithine/succinylornithine family transaminase [Candidatus Dormibacteraeota bacterium]